MISARFRSGLIYYSIQLIKMYQSTLSLVVRENQKTTNYLGQSESKGLLTLNPSLDAWLKLGFVRLAASLPNVYSEAKAVTISGCAIDPIAFLNSISNLQTSTLVTLFIASGCFWNS